MIEVLFSALLAYTVGLVVYRLWLDPLAKFPGPKLAALTRYYEGYYDVIKRGQYTFKIAELHKQYGPIIRISPYELHVNEPTFYKQLYRQDGHWNKYAWSYDAFGVPLATVMTVDHNVHKKRRATVSPYFSRATVASRQQTIRNGVDKLHDRLKEHALTSPDVPINLGLALSAMATDIATDYILGKSYNNLSRPDFNPEMTKALQGSGAIWHITKHVRFFGPLMRAIPPSIMEKTGDPDIAAFMAYMRESKARVQELLADSKPTEIEEPSSTPTLVHAIAQSNVPPSERSEARIQDDIDTITGAALETTAQALRLIVYYLYRDPKLLHRLRSELNQHLAQNYTLIELEQLPYLTAVLMEGLRLAPGIATRMARITPDRDLIFDDRWTIPAGTPVSMTTLLMHTDPSVYPDPYRFDPDRWADLHERKGDVSHTFAPFSRGTRNCLGMHLAWAELYFTLVMLVRNFDIDLDKTTAEDVDAYYDAFVVRPKTESGVVVKLSLC